MKNNWFQYFLFLLLIIFALQSCDEAKVKEVDSNEITWIYISFNLLESDSTDILYNYYGTVNAQVYKELSKNTFEGSLFPLNNIRFIGMDEKLYIYENDFEADEFLINKECIRSIDLLKDDPILHYEDSDLAEDALRFKRGEKVQSKFNSSEWE